MRSNGVSISVMNAALPMEAGKETETPPQRKTSGRKRTREEAESESSETFQGRLNAKSVYQNSQTPVPKTLDRLEVPEEESEHS